MMLKEIKIDFGDTWLRLNFLERSNRAQNRPEIIQIIVAIVFKFLKIIVFSYFFHLLAEMTREKVNFAKVNEKNQYVNNYIDEQKGWEKEIF